MSFIAAYRQLELPTTVLIYFRALLEVHYALNAIRCR